VAARGTGRRAAKLVALKMEAISVGIGDGF
jgi:hypothetical protein